VTDFQTEFEASHVLRWIDAQGKKWDLHAHTEILGLVCQEESFSIPRDQWESRINYNEVANGFVFRFDSGKREIGFLVTRDEGQTLLDTLQWTHDRAVASTNRVATSSRRAHHWPTMTAWAIVALAAACLSFFPIVGLAFVILAIISIFMAHRRAKNNERMRHVRYVLIASILILVVTSVGLLLGTYLFLNDSSLEPAKSHLLTGEQSRGHSTALLAMLTILLSLSVHECAHAVTAWWCGDLLPVQQGRVSLNPLVHIDPIGTILVPAVLYYSSGMLFGWAKPVMISLQGVPNPRRANILISAAGPFSNFLLGMLFLAVYLILGCVIRLWLPQAQIFGFWEAFSDVQMSGFAGAGALAMFTIFLKWGFAINFLLMFFNLIPIPPLDGGHVLGSLFPRTVGAFYHKLGPFKFIIFLGLIFSGVLGYLLAPAVLTIYLGHGLVAVTTGL